MYKESSGSKLHTAGLIVVFASILFCASLAINAGTARAATTPTTEQSACMANGTCTCTIVRAGGVDGVENLVCTQVNANSSTTTTSTNINNGTGVASTQNTDGTVSDEPVKSATCSPFEVLCSLKQWGAGFIAYTALVILYISTFLLWISGLLFNWVIIRTVFEFGQYFGNSAGLLLAWSIMRDIGNIVLLFGFIFMGIATILNTHSMDEYSAKKALPRLIIFAILLNFSLFASQAVIDVSNAFGSTFAIQAGVNCQESSQTTGGENNCANQGISGRILTVTGMASPFTTDFIKQQAEGIGDDAPRQIVMYIGSALFVTITAVVLAAGAIMLAIRAVTLIFLMITSPVGFAGMAVPQFQGLARKWWDALISQAFFAPVYILLILMSVKVAGELSNGQSLVTALASGNSDKMQMVLVFMIAIGLMVASLMVAKKIGAMGANFATSTAGGAVLGTYGFIGRRTIGAASNAAASRITSSKWDNVNPNMRRLAYGIANKGATASYSPRSLATKYGKGSGLDFGKPNKTAAHGFHGIEEKAEKARTEFAKKLDMTEAEKQQEKKLKDNKKSSENKWKSRRKELDTEIAEKEKRVKMNESGETRTELDRRVVELSTESQAAIARGDTAAARESLTKLDGVKAEIANLNETAARDTAALAELQAALTSEAAMHTEEIANIDAAIRANNPYERYATQVEAPKWYSTIPVIKQMSVGGHADHIAADKIRKNTTKSDIDKALDTIKENTKKTAENTHDDDHDDHGGGGAPAPKGGGGAHAPAH